MTSISGSMSAAQMMSPNDRMKLALQSAVSTGTVKSTDQSTLSSALDDIDAAMKSSGPPTAGTSADAMKSKIESLIDQEVSNGKLTDDQATELKQVFADAADSMQGPGGPGGPGGAGGPPPPPPSSETSDSSDDTSTSSTDATDTTKSAIEQLVAFLKKLEDSMTSTSPYTSTGSSTASGSTTSMLVNSLA
ncbi:hypothetical protein [Sphingomonas sp.]|uniref:hypothetical protein n=1 Tax=Sphingomonas sp. TaxID=28214 RepID=UPI000DB522FF|nr:hypothetical protein [Sphingomonas sp.]PZU09135.1 MAG: hypothetical protein DI605_10180 [Sphingomonas sp.]